MQLLKREAVRNSHKDTEKSHKDSTNDQLLKREAVPNSHKDTELSHKDTEQSQRHRTETQRQSEGPAVKTWNKKQPNSVSERVQVHLLLTVPG